MHTGSLAVVLLVFLGCGSVDPAGPSLMRDHAETTIAPHESATLSLRNGASLHLQAGTFDSPVRLILEETNTSPVDGALGPTVRLTISASPLGKLHARKQLATSSEEPIRLCIPSSNTSLSSVDIMIHSEGATGYAWAGRTAGNCVEIDLPPGLYEAEFTAILADRASGAACAEFRLVADENNQPTRKKAIILIHGLQLDRPTCESFKDFNPTNEYWRGLLTGVVNCSACSNIHNEYNIYYFKYPTIVQPVLSAANLRVELNRLASSSDPLSSSTELVLIGYSMGGLVGRHFIQVNEFSKIQKLVTLGTPHLGTYEILTNPGLAYRAGLNVVKSPFPDTDGTRSLSWQSGFIKNLNSRDIGNRRNIYTYAGHVQSVDQVLHPELWLSFGAIQRHITSAERSVLAVENDAVVPVESASLPGSVEVGTLEGYDHYDLRDGKEGPNDPIWVSLRALLTDLSFLATEVRGKLVKRGVPLVGWPVYLITEPDTFYFFDRIAELPISTTTTQSDGTFIFSGLETNRSFAFLSINPRSSTFISDEMRYTLFKDLPLREGESFVIPEFDVSYQNIDPFDNILRFDFRLANPGSITFTWPAYTQVAIPRYTIHLHFRDSQAPCWFSPTTFATNTRFSLVCNSSRHAGQRVGPGKFYWYVAIHDSNEALGSRSGYSYPDYFTLADIRGNLAPAIANDRYSPSAGSIGRGRDGP